LSLHNNVLSRLWADSFYTGNRPFLSPEEMPALRATIGASASLWEAAHQEVELAVEQLIGDINADTPMRASLGLAGVATVDGATQARKFSCVYNHFRGGRSEPVVLITRYEAGPDNDDKGAKRARANAAVKDLVDLMAQTTILFGAASIGGQYIYLDASGGEGAIVSRHPLGRRSGDLSDEELSQWGLVTVWDLAGFVLRALQQQVPDDLLDVEVDSSCADGAEPEVWSPERDNSDNSSAASDGAEEEKAGSAFPDSTATTADNEALASAMRQKAKRRRNKAKRLSKARRKRHITKASRVVKSITQA
jgi:hypothetical protein